VLDQFEAVVAGADVVAGAAGDAADEEGVAEGARVEGVVAGDGSAGDAADDLPDGGEHHRLTDRSEVAEGAAERGDSEGIAGAVPRVAPPGGALVVGPGPDDGSEA
jgi:hypothetical protein